MAKKATSKKSIKKNEKKVSVKKVSPKKQAVKKVAVKKSANKTPFKAHVTSLKAGQAAPFFTGVDQHNNTVSLSDFAGKTLVLYFYPKDDTSGCTAQSCNLRDEYQYLTKENYAVVGVSADNVKSHKKFADKFSLPFPLIADVDKKIIKDYDVWGDKMMYGRVYQAIVRTTFIIKDKKIQRVITAVDTENHAKQVLEG
jgi:peroxiredoxin Q/BCP